MRDGLAAITLTLLLPQAGSAAPPPRSEPKLMSDAFACAAITDNPQRLACYDKALAAIKQAYANQDLVVADRAEIRKAKRSLFGLSLPAIDLFGGGKDREDSEITAALVSARFQADGTLMLVLDGGGSWAQVDDNTVPALPKAGTPVTVRKGALGSFIISWSHYSFKAHRVVS